jgi:hypothetical protein
MSRNPSSTSGSPGYVMLKALLPNSLASCFAPILIMSGLVAFLRPRKKSSIEIYTSAHPISIPREDTKLSSGDEESLISLMQQKMPSVFGIGAEFKSVSWLPTYVLGASRRITCLWRPAVGTRTPSTRLWPILRRLIQSIMKGQVTRRGLVASMLTLALAFAYVRFLINFADGGVYPLDWHKLRWANCVLIDKGLSGIDVSPPSSVKPFQPGEPILFVCHVYSAPLAIPPDGFTLDPAWPHWRIS